MSDCWCCGGPGAPSTLLAPLPFQECGRCGFAFREDRDDSVVHAVYQGGEYEDMHGKEYLRELGDRRWAARVRLRALAPYARSGRLLDVGAAGGAFVLEAGKAGFQAEGVEPTPAFAALARENLGVIVRTGTVGTLEPEDGTYDACTLWHVLEHIPSPAEEMERLHRALRPGGVIGIEVPNAGGIHARGEGAAWPSLQPEVHVGQYTPAALEALLTRAGFTLLHMGTATASPYLRPVQRLAPRHVAHRARASRRLRTVSARHATAHELLRAFARA